MGLEYPDNRETVGPSFLAEWGACGQAARKEPTRMFAQNQSLDQVWPWQEFDLELVSKEPSNKEINAAGDALRLNALQNSTSETILMVSNWPPLTNPR